MRNHFVELPGVGTQGSRTIRQPEINGNVESRRPSPKGEMIIRVTDAEGAYVPRFCYHEKLSIAANCRMCLVEVEKAPKPLPACATPVAEGMKIFTHSPRAIGAQRATMEFLLINHPLDCPICDQGGECELQDLAVGFGRDISRFNERKRSVPDENLGPLDRHRHDPLHSLHALRALHRRDRGLPGTGHDRPRRADEGARRHREDAWITSCPATSWTCARWARSFPSRSASAAAAGR